jgi:hypothetical protein
VVVSASASALYKAAQVLCLLDCRPLVAGWAFQGDVSPSVTHLPPAFGALTDS